MMAVMGMTFHFTYFILLDQSLVAHYHARIISAFCLTQFAE